MADAIAKLAQLMSWETFADLLISFWDTLRLPDSDNSTIIYDLIVFYASSDPLIFAMRAGLVWAFIAWFQSMATGLHSWVDKIWPIVPALYAIHFSVRDMFFWPADQPFNYVPRVYLATALIFLWGARATYNFGRQGGYSFEFEDYRWKYMGDKMPAGIWFFFNIFFICLFQNQLLVFLTVPVYMAWRASLATVTPLNWIDLVATVGALAGLVLENVAEHQKWVFEQSLKKAVEKKEALTGDYKRGFLTQGVWKYSRHPNFAGELIMWCSIYLYSVAAGYPEYVEWINPSIAGVAVLTMLYQGAITTTENIFSAKFPAYKLYRQTTSRLIPLSASTPLDVVEKKVL
ncbi:hypothetical protein BGZ93_010485 [Podila epicladia]|nr:hypothetical protein BGZ92_002027 [Podila epicladia]KAG0088308.1 hypothetical protein BGZ93_010485 [Podila epicladia]